MLFRPALALALLSGASLAAAQSGTVGPLKPQTGPITMPRPQATLAPVGETVTLTIETIGPGKVTINGIFCIPKGSGNVKTCTRQVAKGQPYDIKAIPDADGVFFTWHAGDDWWNGSGCDIGHSITCGGQADTERTWTVQFRPVEAAPTLTVTYRTYKSESTADTLRLYPDPSLPFACSSTSTPAGAGKNWTWVYYTCTAKPAPGSMQKLAAKWRTNAGNEYLPILDSDWQGDCHRTSGATCTLDMRISRKVDVLKISPDAK